MTQVIFSKKSQAQPGRICLKLGITIQNRASQDVITSIENQFNKKDLIKVFKYHVCNTELQARKIERKMLTQTIAFIDTDIPESFGGDLVTCWRAVPYPRYWVRFTCNQTDGGILQKTGRTILTLYG
jgi:RNA-binding protein YhbY